MYERVATWTPARGLCHSLGANLAPIFKQADSEAARYYGTSYGIGRGNEAWIGVYRTSTSSPWCVERGTSAQPQGPTPCVGLQYTRWDSGQPINNGGSELYVFVKTAGTWEDYGDSPSWWFVCHQGFACASCTVGKFSSTSGLSTCASCALGSYQDIAGSSFCTLCPPGRYSVATGATNLSTCTMCSSGSYQNISGSSVCRLCPPGEFSNTTGLINCVQCAMGTFSATSALSTCDLCATG